MKPSELLLNLISIPVDGLMLLFAALVAFYVRAHSIELVGPIIYTLQLDVFLNVAYRIIPILLIIFALLGLYNLRGTRNVGQEIAKILEGVSLGLLLVMLLFFFDQTIFPSRFIILATWGFGIVFVVLGRLGLKLLQGFMFSRDIGLHKLIIINGHGNNAAIIEQVYLSLIHI